MQDMHEMQEMRPENAEHQVRGDLPTSANGRLKLSNWVIATVPSALVAETCAQSLEEAGFAADDVLVESGATALRQLQAEEDSLRHASALARLVTTVEDAISEVSVHEMRDRYVADAQAGRAFVGAHDSQGNQVDIIRNLFVEQGASDIYYFGPTATTRLG